MNLLFVLAAANILCVAGAVITGYTFTEIAAFLALNIATLGLIVCVLCVQGLKTIYDMISNTKGEVDVRKIE